MSEDTEQESEETSAEEEPKRRTTVVLALLAYAMLTPGVILLVMLLFVMSGFFSIESSASSVAVRSLFAVLFITAGIGVFRRSYWTGLILGNILSCVWIIAAGKEIFLKGDQIDAGYGLLVIPLFFLVVSNTLARGNFPYREKPA